MLWNLTDHNETETVYTHCGFSIIKTNYMSISVNDENRPIYAPLYIRRGATV
jgi:hypothetical protein